MNNYSIFDKNTGEILRRVSTYSPVELQLTSQNEDSIKGDFDDELFYVDIATRLPLHKMEMPLELVKLQAVADGLDTVVLRGIPVDAVAIVENRPGTESVITDGVFEMDCDQPGNWKVRITSPQYHPKEITVEAIPPA